jgi:hypothetical protein
MVRGNSTNQNDNASTERLTGMFSPNCCLMVCEIGIHLKYKHIWLNNANLDVTSRIGTDVMQENYPD